MDTRFENQPTWREYQDSLRRGKDVRHLLYRLRWAVCAVGVLAVLGFGVKAHYRDGAAAKKIGSKQSSPTGVSLDAATAGIHKQDIRAWLPPGSVINLEEKSFNVQVNQSHYRVDTSLDLSLQTHLLKKVRNSNAELMGLVVLDPDSGKVLAMVGIGNDDSAPNPCLDNTFPAASVFKIITAAAAIEQCGFNSETRLTFNGGKYTLYKSQLKNKVTRYTNTISFQDSFAQSVNPVFGKIGAQRLGRELLEKYGEAFGFNRDIDFEVAIPPSNLEVGDGPYHVAEIACGFNRMTTLTPLHGALIAAAVLDGGRLPEPSIIDQVLDENGRKLYQSKPAVFGEAFSSRVGELLGDLMTRTISSGTCRKAFRGARRDRVLSRLIIGGKTGTIDNRAHDKRIDWFVGFARDKKSGKKITVAVVVAHGKYIGTRASEFARFTFEDYFKEYFAAADDKHKSDG